MSERINLQEDKQFISKLFLISTIPLILIIVSEIFKIFFFQELSTLKDKEKYIGWWTLAQLILSPTLGMISDGFCRKKMLIFTLFSLVLSAIFLKMGWSIIIALILYSIGAVTPIARAAYCDVHITNRRVPNIINTFIVQPIPWIFFYKFSFSSPSQLTSWPSYLLFSSGILMTIICWIWFKDERDKEHRKLSFRFKGIREEYGWLLCLRVLLAFFLSNMIWNMLQYFFEEETSNQVAKSYFSIGPGLAFLVGALIARYIDIDKKKMLGLIFLFIAVFSGLLFLEGRAEEHAHSIRPIFVAFTFFGGIGLPLIFAFFGRKADLHEQGVLYGLLDSFQTATEWTGSFALGRLGARPDPTTIVNVVVIVSFISFLVTGSLIRTRWINKENGSHNHE